MLPLVRDPLAQGLGLGFGPGEGHDSGEGQTERCARGVLERFANRGVPFPAGQSNFEQRVVFAGLDLGCQETRRGLPGLSRWAFRVDYRYPSAGQRQLPGTGRADRPATHDDNIAARTHLYSYETN